MKSNLKYYREKAGLTMQELGHMAGMHKSQIHRLEKDGANPTINTAYEIATSLRVKDILDIWTPVA